MDITALVIPAQAGSDLRFAGCDTITIGIKMEPGSRRDDGAKVRRSVLDRAY